MNMLQEELNKKLIKNAMSGNLEIVKSLIEQGADVNAKDIDGWTALIRSSKKGYLEVVKYLIDKGADVNAKTNNGTTALMNSSDEEHLDIVKYLINKGADINSKDNIGWTALIFSSYGEEVVKYLINKGADLEAKDELGNTALEYIKSNTILDSLIPYIKKYKFFEGIYNDLEIEQKHILFKHFINNVELLEQVNPRIMKGFIPDINEWKNNLK